MKRKHKAIKIAGLLALLTSLGTAYATTCYLSEVALAFAPGDSMGSGHANCGMGTVNVSVSCIDANVYQWSTYVVTKGGYATASSAFYGAVAENLGWQNGQPLINEYNVSVDYSAPCMGGTSSGNIENVDPPLNVGNVYWVSNIHYANMALGTCN